MTLASELIEGIEVPDCGVSGRPLEAIVLVKTLTDDGQVEWSQHFTPTISSQEALGVLVLTAKVVERELIDRFEAPDDAA